nr:MAG TPA: hypothetical protein [Crassvirales sp.]
MIHTQLTISYMYQLYRSILRAELIIHTCAHIVTQRILKAGGTNHFNPCSRETSL